MKYLSVISVCCTAALLQIPQANAAQSTLADSAKSVTVLPGSLPPSPPTPVVSDYELKRVAPSRWRCTLRGASGGQFDLAIGLGKPSQVFDNGRGYLKSVPVSIQSSAMGEFAGEGTADWWKRSAGWAPDVFEYYFHINSLNKIYEFRLSNFANADGEIGAIIIQWANQSPTPYASQLKPYAVGFCDREAALSSKAPK